MCSCLVQLPNLQPLEPFYGIVWTSLTHPEDVSVTQDTLLTHHECIKTVVHEAKKDNYLKTNYACSKGPMHPYSLLTRDLCWPRLLTSDLALHPISMGIKLVNHCSSSRLMKYDRMQLIIFLYFNFVVLKKKCID